MIARVGIVLAIILFYFPIFFYGFSQDDFIHQYSSQAKNFGEVLNFFNPFAHFPDIFFYRPLTTQFYFFINNLLFGFNPIPFRTEALAVHLLNSFLVYKLVLKLDNKRPIAILSSLFYGISAIHFLSLFYISSFQQIGRAFFMLSSMILFLKFLEDKKKLFYTGSLLTFVLALLSKETSIVLPFLLAVLIFFKLEKSSYKNALLQTLPFFAVAGIFLLIRLSGFNSVFNEGAYSFQIDIKTFYNNLKWYLLWIFGLPEIISTYPSLGPASIKMFARDYQLSLPILVSLAILISSLLAGFWKFKGIDQKQLWFTFFFCLVSIAPVLFLNGHRYPQYLDLPLVVLLPLLATVILFDFKKRWILSICLIASFLALQFFSLRLSQQIHWTTHRSKVATHYKNILDPKMQSISKPTIIYFTGTDQALKELSVAIAIGYGLKDWYGDKIERVLYVNNQENFKPTGNYLIQLVDFH